MKPILAFFKINFVFVFFLIGTKAFPQKDCELRRDQDSIFVYTCPTPNSNLKSIRSKFILKAKLSELAAQVFDVEEYPAWQYRMIKAKVLKEIAENERIYQSEISAPWPVTNREMIVHIKIEQDPLTKTVTILTEDVPDLVPLNEDKVRVPELQGKWIVTPMAKNKLSIEYSFLVDPGGSVPAWLVNMAVAEGPHETFKNLKQRIKDGKGSPPLNFIID